MSSCKVFKGLGDIEGLKTTIVHCILYTAQTQEGGGGGWT